MALVEIEGASVALNQGDKIAVSSSTTVAAAQKRVALILANPSETDTIWLTLGDDAAVVGEGVPLFPQSGLILKQYHGAVKAISSGSSVDLARAEF